MRTSKPKKPRMAGVATSTSMTASRISKSFRSAAPPSMSRHLRPWYSASLAWPCRSQRGESGGTASGCWARECGASEKKRKARALRESGRSTSGLLVWRELGTALGEEPLRQLRLGVDPLPDVVVDTRVFGVERMAAGFAACSDAVAGSRDRDGLVRVAVKVPEGRVNGGGAVVGGEAGAERHGCREDARTVGDDVPDASAAHGLAGDVDAAIIDCEFAGQAADQLQRQATTVSQAGNGRGGLLRKIVTSPAAIALRGDDVAGAAFLIFRKEPDAGAVNVAEAELLLIVIAEAAAAVQIRNQGKFSGGLRAEETIGHGPIAFVSARLEFLFQALGLFFERFDQGDALRRHGGSRRKRRRGIVLCRRRRGIWRNRKIETHLCRSKAHAG